MENIDRPIIYRWGAWEHYAGSYSNYGQSSYPTHMNESSAHFQGTVNE